MSRRRRRGQGNRSAVGDGRSACARPLDRSLRVVLAREGQDVRIRRKARLQRDRRRSLREGVGVGVRDLLASFIPPVERVPGRRRRGQGDRTSEGDLRAARGGARNRTFRRVLGDVSQGVGICREARLQGDGIGRLREDVGVFSRNLDASLIPSVEGVAGRRRRGQGDRGAVGNGRSARGGARYAALRRAFGDVNEGVRIRREARRQGDGVVADKKRVGVICRNEGISRVPAREGIADVRRGGERDHRSLIHRRAGLDILPVNGEPSRGAALRRVGAERDGDALRRGGGRGGGRRLRLSRFGRLRSRRRRVGRPGRRPGRFGRSGGRGRVRRLAAGDKNEKRQTQQRGDNDPSTHKEISFK